MVIKVGGYNAVDKSKERAKIASFLKQDESVCLESRTKPLKKGNGPPIKFDENGKWVK